MSYCRFENTLSDLEDCVRVLREGGREITKGTETEAAVSMVEMILQFADELGEDADPVEYIGKRTEQPRGAESAEADQDLAFPPNDVVKGGAN
jgi:hypothetical protein